MIFCSKYVLQHIELCAVFLLHRTNKEHVLQVYGQKVTSAMQEIILLRLQYYRQCSCATEPTISESLYPIHWLWPFYVAAPVAWTR